MTLPRLIALDDYTAPPMPTEHVIRAAWTRLKRQISGAEDPVLQTSGLEPGSLAVIDDLADPPDCGPLLEALDERLGAWLRDAGAQPKVMTLVTAPCDTVGTLALRAQTRGHALLPEPDRIDLMGAVAESDRPDLTGDGLLVIPRLEHWFLRERNGLHGLRSLLSQLACTERRCIVGCDSWAWRFIVKGADADLTLPSPNTFEPFDARRLREWFAALALGGDGVTTTFRLADSGDDVLACDDDGEPRNTYLQLLAARSRGIPWVAWHLWRAGLRVSVGREPLSERAVVATAGDARTVWVIGVDDVVLPPSNEDRALMVLQALLIHGALTPSEIDAVLPRTGEPDMLAAMVTSGHVQRERGSSLYRVQPSAYPAVRGALEAAGFPSGAI